MTPDLASLYNLPGVENSFQSSRITVPQYARAEETPNEHYFG
jgi:hypothetical protein